MSTYGLAIVGFGGMGSWHATRIKDVEGLTLKGVFDISEKRQEFAREKGIHTYTSLSEILADPSVHIVLIATPNDLHKEIAITAMDAGRHVICEKPVTLSSGDLAEMIDASTRNKVLFTVHQNRRWDEDYLTMKKIFDEKQLGNVFSIESRVHGSRGIPGDWRGRAAHGGGMILDWGVHILDQMVLMVPGKIKKVYCKCTHVTNEEVDDGFRIILTFESGVTALLEVGTSNFINLPRWYMQGENGSAIIENWALQGKIIHVTNYDNRDAVPIVTAAGLTKTMAPRTEDTIKESALPKVELDAREFYKNVIATLDGKAAQIVKNDQVMRIMKLMEAAFLSDKLNQVVDFE